MTITELREQGFDVDDYVIIPNHEYVYECTNEEEKIYYLYFGKIVKQDGKYYIDGYVINTDTELHFRNPHSTYGWTWTSSNNHRISTIQPIMQSVDHISVLEGYSIKKVSKDAFDALKTKLTNVADDIFEVFLKA